MSDLIKQDSAHRRRPAGFLALLGAAIAACSAGCGPHARLELYQPPREGRQQLLQLESFWAHFASDDETADRLLLAWPLPGSTVGQKQYLLYMRLPRGGGDFGVGPDAGEDSRAVGFLIQRAGRLAGLTGVTRGRIDLSGGAKLRTGQLHLKCADGTELEGTFRAERSDLTVTFFEEDHSGDVASLSRPETSGDTDAASTENSPL